MNSVQAIPFAVLPEEVASLLGCTARTGARVRGAIAEGLRQVEAVALPRAAWARTTARPTPAGFLLGGRHEVKSKRLKMVFDRCPEALAFVVSIGPGVDELVEETRRLGDAFVVDAIASLAVEKVAESFEGQIRSRLSPEEGLTLRYSPGYCDWALAGQAALFDIFDGAAAGVSLSKHCLMQPRKSISGLVGVGPREQLAGRENACRWCGIKDCDYRREL